MPVFVFEDQHTVADLLRGDMATARREWVRSARTVAETQERGDDDFLAPVNAEGETLDFHSLRHTCGGVRASLGPQ